MKHKIRYFVMDVDGTLTDGKIYIGNEGEIFKAFDVKDGCGIKDILPSYNIVPVIITSRRSNILEYRCGELDIHYLFQGIKNKVECLCDLLESEGASLSEVAYIGDDISDLKCMLQIINAGGICGCPNDAVQAVKDECQFIANRKGGDGAVREFIEYLVKDACP